MSRSWVPSLNLRNDKSAIGFSNLTIKASQPYHSSSSEPSSGAYSWASYCAAMSLGLGARQACATHALSKMMMSMSARVFASQYGMHPPEFSHRLVDSQNSTQECRLPSELAMAVARALSEGGREDMQCLLKALPDLQRKGKRTSEQQTKGDHAYGTYLANQVRACSDIVF